MMEKENFIRELNAWITFYKDGSMHGKSKEDQTYNKGVTDGIKLMKDLMRRHVILTKEDLNKIN